MEFEIEKGVTYTGDTFEEWGIIVNSGDKGILKENNVEDRCIVSFPTLQLGWRSLKVGREKLLANGLSYSETWDYMFPNHKDTGRYNL
ncbi:MAG: hypothetical protein EOM85_00025 [Candidatus Moranbacteria bacterium]|nr:hypothetical protein [Candidatus Moranbacteria bacterium]